MDDLAQFERRLREEERLAKQKEMGGDNDAMGGFGGGGGSSDEASASKDDTPFLIEVEQARLKDVHTDISMFFLSV